MGAFLDQPITEKRVEKYQHKKLRACTVEMQGKMMYESRLEKTYGRCNPI